VATVLVQNGTLRIGDNVVVGRVYGKIRALTDDAGHRVKEAGPSKPVLISGLTDVATAGDVLQVMETEKAARALAELRTNDQRAKVAQPVRRITLSDFAAVQGETKTMTLVLKAEANGSLEALRSQVTKLEDPNVAIKIVGEGVGAVGEADVNLAAVSGAIVIGFNVHPDDRAKAAAEELGVDVRFYDVV
jgi:translation initiation factor IF-2